ncbi:DUF3102 domain-containing protein [Bosea caraganae]|uniref:DUF3102 domain-containing protein n=1 Tax=Bosea caraganae TaxID=2763117 RepID=A0A370KYQ0_9HYPH|nr:DUF3102 domain-containing protein [Bosea caraganae]RDJ20118.1 DUF3102 domain-containing protein [Bosea caraganae]RDJ24830.1 DUF3102 domain-containing protein [Bosea caraganae]
MTAVAIRDKAGFDYAGLDPTEAEQARGHAAWVRDTYGALQATTMETVAEIGLRLLQARETVGHGKFMPWVSSECGFSHSTALRMMDVAENIGPDQIRHVMNLPASFVYKVAAKSTPPEIREEFKAQLAAGERIYTGTIESRILEARMKAKRAKKRMRMSPAQIKASDARERREEAESERRAAESQAALAAARAVVEALFSRLTTDETEKLLELGKRARYRVADVVIERLGALTAADIAILA